MKHTRKPIPVLVRESDSYLEELDERVRLAQIVPTYQNPISTWINA